MLMVTHAKLVVMTHEIDFDTPIDLVVDLVRAVVAVGLTVAVEVGGLT